MFIESGYDPSLFYSLLLIGFVHKRIFGGLKKLVPIATALVPGLDIAAKIGGFGATLAGTLLKPGGMGSGRSPTLSSFLPPPPGKSGPIVSSLTTPPGGGGGWPPGSSFSVYTTYPGSRAYCSSRSVSQDTGETCGRR